MGFFMDWSAEPWASLVSFLTGEATQGEWQGLSLTLCGLTGQKTHQGGPGLGGSVHEEAHPCFPYFAERTFKSINAGGFHRPLVQLIPPINYSIRKEIFTTVPCAPKFN